MGSVMEARSGNSSRRAHSDPTMQAIPSDLIVADGLYMSYAIGARQVPVLRGVDLRLSAGKRLGQTHPETLARLVARPINWLAIATKPFVKLL